MILGAWGMKKAGGAPTATSYVQDGLVAMWDGIENAGWRTHDANAATWVDLGPNEIDVSIANIAFAIRDKAVVFKGKQASAENALAATSVHLEVVCQRTIRNIHSSTRVIVKVGEAALFRGEGTYQGGPFCIVEFNEYSSKGVGFGIPNIETVDSPVSLSYKQIFSNSNDQYGNKPYVAGEKVNSLAYIGAHWAAPNSTILFGDTSSADGEISIYSVRSYNRELTAAEVAANYAVDAQRFNLNGGRKCVVVLAILRLRSSRSWQPSRRARLWKEAA